MERILVVEDDLALSTGLCFELDNAGYLTVAAYNCAKARYLLEHEQFSLALLDVNLPDGNGFDLCREIKAQKPELPVIFHADPPAAGGGGPAPGRCQTARAPG